MLCTTNYLNNQEVSNQYAVYLEYRKVVIHAALGIYFTLYLLGSLEQDIQEGSTSTGSITWSPLLGPLNRSTELGLPDADYLV